MRPFRVDFDSLPWSAPLPGVRHKLHRVGERILRLVEYSPAMPPHWCERGHAGRIESGRLQLEFARHVETLGPGDLVLIPSGREHAHRALALDERVVAWFVEDAPA